MPHDRNQAIGISQSTGSVWPWFVHRCTAPLNRSSSSSGAWSPPAYGPSSWEEAKAAAMELFLSEGELRAIAKKAATAAGLDPALLWAWLLAHQGAPQSVYVTRWGLNGLWGMSKPRFETEAAYARYLGLLGEGIEPWHVFTPAANARAAAASLVRMFNTWDIAGQELGAITADWIAGGFGKGAVSFADALSDGYASWEPA